MNLLNSAIMNLNLIQSNKFSPCFEPVYDLFPDLRKFTQYFRESIKQKKISLTIDGKVHGSKCAVSLFHRHGIVLDTNLYQ